MRQRWTGLERGTALVGVCVAVLTVLSVGGPPGTGDLVGAFLFGPALAMVGLFVAAAMLTALHEAAHAIVGRLFGGELIGVSVGQGNRLFAFRLGSTRIDVRQSLIGGITVSVPRHGRFGQVAFVLAGVAAEAAVIGVMWMWHPSLPAAVTLRWVVIGVAGLDIILNLWPRTVSTAFGEQMTDGGQLLDMLRNGSNLLDGLDRDDVIDQARIAVAINFGDIERGLTLARAFAADRPADTDRQQLLGTALVSAARWREGFEVLAPLTADPDVDPIVCNNAAWGAVMTFDSGLLEFADSCSERAFRAHPALPAIANTRGSTLVMLGRVDEAMPMLEHALTGPLTSEERAFVTGFIALGDHACGRFPQARQRRDEVMRLDPASPIVEVVRARIDNWHSVPPAPAPLASPV